VTVPGSATPPTGPTGQVLNGAAAAGAFSIPAAAGGTVAATFLFDTLAGTIDEWNPASTGGRNLAVIMATTPGAVYRGLASGQIVGAAN